MAIGVVRVLVEGAVEAGLVRAHVLARLGVHEGDLARSDGRVEVARVLETWSFVMRALRDPSVPVTLGARVKLADYGIFGFATMTGGTGREVLSRAVRLHALLTDSARLELHEQDDRATIRWTRKGALALGHRAANEFALTGLLVAARQILGWRVRPLEVSFRHEAPEDTSAHEAFFGCPVRWGQDDDELVLPRGLLDEVPTISDAALSTYLLDRAEAKLRDLGVDGTWRSRVERAIRSRLAAGTATITDVARELGASERTLRRALAAEQTSFESLMREVREERARVLLRRSDLKLLDIALELGFADAAAFSHAFKRWTGRPPRDYRCG